MAEKKSGPVKPPIIDAKPRETGNAAPEPKTARGPRAAEKPASATEAPATKSNSDANPSGASGGPAPKPSATDPQQDKGGKDDPAKSQAPQSGNKPQSADNAESQSGPTRHAETATAPLTSEPGAAPIQPLAPLLTSAVAGALIGLALAYGLASFGLWPSGDREAATALAELETRTAQIENSTALQEAETTTAMGRIDSLEADLSARIEEIAGATPSMDGLAAQTDLDEIESRLTELSGRFDALAAGASGEEASEIASQITMLSDTVTALSDRLDTLEPQLQTMAPTLEDAVARIEDLDARIADQPAFDAVSAERDRLARLPATLDALDRAIVAGEPFAGPLSEITTLLPSLAIPDDAQALAAFGVATEAMLLDDFRAAIPSMLNARPEASDANWAQSLLDQAGAALALRPTEGDSPQALVGRIESAIESGDLATAQDIFSQLPAPMQQAAPGFADALGQSLAARELLATARATDPATQDAEAAQ